MLHMTSISDLSKKKKATKVGAIVGGQTSCKGPELAAFEKHLPEDVEIVSCHSLHGPKVNPKGQPLVGAHPQPISSQPGPTLSNGC